MTPERTAGEVRAPTPAAQTDLHATLAALSSGHELVADGYGADVDLAAAHADGDTVPRLRDGVSSG